MEISADKAITVAGFETNAAATITSTNPGVGRFDFTVSGAIDVDGLNFGSAKTNGLHVTDSGSFTKFDNVTFTNAQSGARHMRVEQQGPVNITFNNVSLDASFGSGKNITLEDTFPTFVPSLSDGGTDVKLRVASSLGAGAGRAFEEEINTAFINWGNEVDWINASGGNWNTASNWSTGGVPGSTSDVIIDFSGTYTVTLDVNTTITSLTLGNSSGPQTLSVNGKTLTLNGPGASTIDNNGVLDFNGGTLTGGGDLTVNGAFNWTGGTMSGSGTTSIASGGTLTLSGGSTKTLSGRTVDNAGTATLSNTGEFDLRNGVVFTNQAGGTFDAQSDAFIDHGFGTAPTFSNNGTFKKSGGTGTTTFEPVFNNTGVVQVQSGTLDLTGGGTSSGSFDAASGTTLDFGGGTHTLNTGATFTGAGSSRVVGGTATVNGAATAANFAQTGGTLNGGNTLTVSGTFNWTGGTMSGSGTTSIASGGTLTFSGGSTKTLSGRTIDNAGTAILKDAGEFDLRDGAVFINQAGGVFDAQSDAFIDHGFGTVPTFGIFQKGQIWGWR